MRPIEPLAGPDSDRESMQSRLASMDSQGPLRDRHQEGDGFGRRFGRCLPVGSRCGKEQSHHGEA